jgi:hypothetical protein
MHADEDWDWLKHYKAPEKTTTRPVSQANKWKREHFVRLPLTWVEQLASTRSANTYRVAIHLHYLQWRGKGDPIKLTNGILAMEGVSRFAKWRALRELEHLGLIMVERRRRKAPLITLVK